MKFKLLVVSALLVASACFLPTDACGCPPALGIGTLAGVVTRASGSAVVGAEVRAQVRLWGCSGPSADMLVDSAKTVTDANGRYNIFLRSFGPTDTACVKITARMVTASGIDSVSYDGLRMRLIPSYGTKLKPDSIRVDLRLTQ